MAQVTIKRVGFKGQVGPVRFTDSVGETDDPDALAYFIEHPDEYDVEGTDPYDVHVPVLRELCRDRGLDDSGRKADLQDRLRAADDATDPD